MPPAPIVNVEEIVRIRAKRDHAAHDRKDILYEECKEFLRQFELQPAEYERLIGLYTRIVRM